MESRYTLDKTFVYKTTTHEHCIRWMCIGKSTGPTIVFIHGTPWSSVEWQNLAACLSSRYKIYLYDHPGFGDSPPSRRLESKTDDDSIDLDPSLTLRAEASAALFKHWDLDSLPHVVAHDNGGLVSVRLLLRHDIRFASLCLIDVVVMGASGLPFFKLVAENESVFTALPPQFIEGLIRAYIKTASYKPLSKEVEDMLSAPWLASGSQGCKGFLREMMQAHHRDVSDIENDYSRVGGLSPTKIIWGSDDAWIPAEQASSLQKAVQAEEMVIVDEAGHLVQYDQPSKLTLEVGLWLWKHQKNVT